MKDEKESKEMLQDILNKINQLRGEIQEVRGIILGIASGDMKFK